MNIEVLKLALLRLEQLNETSIGGPCLPAEVDGAMDALRASLDTSQSHSCTWPAWVGLTDGQLDDVYFCVEGGANAMETWRQQARSIEAALKLKNS